MNPVFILLIELVIIFVTSRFIFQSLFIVIYKLTHSSTVSFFLLSFFFFPGVVVHELSHLFVAQILGVKAYKMEFKPEFHQGSLKMGSVTIEKTDFLRSFLIGVAPLFAGISILSASVYFLFFTLHVPKIAFSFPVVLFGLGVFYSFFTITNTMFSSRKDMDGALKLLIVVILLVSLLYFLRLHPENALFAFLENTSVKSFSKLITIFIAIPLGMNIAVVFVSFPFMKKIVLP